MNDIAIVMTKDELIAELKRLRPLIAADDKAKLKEHRAEEREYLTAFRQACREAARWSYAEANEKAFRLRVNGFRPRCPMPQAAELDRHLELIQKSGQKRFTISNSGRYWKLMQFLTFDVTKPKEVC